MFNPKYRILLTSKCFPQDKVIGLGTQLISIVESIKNHLLPHIWYGADVDAVGKGARKYNLNNIQLSEIGSDLQFIKYSSEIDQFIWGVFVCIDSSFASQNTQCIELETEDEAFRSINTDGILIEIRAFDTTYFEIYTEDEGLITKFSKIYNVKIEKKES